tara:strand:+ start:112 stop:276 length:165 start_codon:yes stop_codon:yes gene_type:complete
MPRIRKAQNSVEVAEFKTKAAKAEAEAKSKAAAEKKKKAAAAKKKAAAKKENKE